MAKLLHNFARDESLLLKFQRGDAAAFEVLYARYKNRLFAFLHRSHVDLAVIEELAQETWLAVINSVDNYRPTARFRTYLFAIAHRKLVDFWRSDSPGRHCEPYDEDSKSEVDSLAAATAWSDNVDTSMDLLLALESLSREQQQAYLLKEEGFSRKEIAIMMNANEETIKSRIRYASNHLRKYLGVRYAD